MLFERGRDFRFGRKGIVFSKKEDLIFFLRGMVLVYRAFPPMAWVKTWRRPYWRNSSGLGILNFRMVLEVVRSYCGLGSVGYGGSWRLGEVDVAALSSFIDLISGEILEALMPFRCRSWQMYCFFCRCPGGLELAESCRSLAFMLANPRPFGVTVQRPMRAARARLKRRRKDIAAGLGFPRREAAVRILGRVPAASLEAPTLLKLREGMRNPAAFKKMCHLPRLNAGVIHVLGDSRIEAAASQGLLEEICGDTSQDYPDDDFHQMMCETVTKHRLLNDGAIPVYGSVGEVFQACERMDELIFERGSLTDVPFPPPPVGGNDNIEYVSSSRELFREGELQKNCLSSPHYISAAFAGELFFYRVLRPQRCTLALCKDETGTWLYDFRASCNSEPSPEAMDEVSRWLADRDGVEDQLELFSGDWDDMPF